MRTLAFLRRLWGRRRAEDELDEEVQAYFETSARSRNDPGLLRCSAESVFSSPPRRSAISRTRLPSAAPPS